MDGLRGLAVAMVVVTHAWTQHPPVIWTANWSHNKMQLVQHPTILDYIANRGYQGVSLFLVLSGFCLSYPILKRRRDGSTTWFQANHFFARRFVRILPAYYVALALCIGLVQLFHLNHWPYLRAMSTDDLGTSNIVLHLLLLHGFTMYDYSINSPFWSLSLEWQWYWLFPIVLLFAIRFPIRTTLTCLIIAMVWQGTMEDNTILTSWPPGRLFEFCCGVLVARQMVSGFKCPPGYLALGAAIAILIAEFPFGTTVGDIGLYQPLYGIAFALTLLLGHTSSIVNRMFSWPPLVHLGIMSYSVYLIHRPISDIIEAFAPLWLRSSYLMIPTAAVVGVGFGAVFYFLVERPCMSKSTWTHISPVLLRLLAWTNHIYPIARWDYSDSKNANAEPVIATNPA